MHPFAHEAVWHGEGMGVTDATRLDGEVAIVTGAAQGIGRGIALVLAEAGAAVVIGDLQDARATVQEIQTHGGEAVSMIMDTSQPDDARALVALALQVYGRLDILVNNAAIDAPVVSLNCCDGQMGNDGHNR